MNDKSVAIRLEFNQFYKDQNMVGAHTFIHKIILLQMEETT